MSLGTDLQDMAVDTITWSPKTGDDGFGNPIFGPSNEYPARLVWKTRLVTGKDQREISSTRQAWVFPSPVSGVPFPMINPDDKVVLSDGLSPLIVKIETFEDETFGGTQEPTHTVAYFL